MNLLGIITLLMCFIHVYATDYCSIKCSGTSSEHTMCKYPEINMSGNCKNYLPYKLTQKDINEILKSHNEYRSKVATGKETRGNPGPQPPASAMNQLYWSEELAEIAQRHADQCEFKHDECRDVEEFYVGQNIYISGHSAHYPDDIVDAVNTWYNEVNLVTGTDIGDYSRAVKGTGHYTQMVHDKTYLIGCGVSKFKSEMYKQLVVCNYGPGGNILGRPVYNTGTPCTQCEEDTVCSNEYEGLCSKINPPSSATTQGYTRMFVFLSLLPVVYSIALCKLNILF